MATPREDKTPRKKRASKQAIKDVQAVYAIKYDVMQGVPWSDYLSFLEVNDNVTIEGKAIKLRGHTKPKKLQPEDFKTETTTFWSFPRRGNWATHTSGYRGNWAPQIARNIIERYSEHGDTVLDQMVGGGTTMVECALTGRWGMGVDVKRDSLMITWDRLNFDIPDSEDSTAVRGAAESVSLFQGDARNLDVIPDETVDLVATHPPYANIIRYSKGSEEQPLADLSNVRSIADYAVEMGRVANEAYRVLKPDHYCAILMGDTRRNKHFTPIAYRVMDAFLQAGFILKEDIIKAQWNTQMEGLWQRLSRDKNFLLIMHEHLFIFRKPADGENIRPFKESTFRKDP